MKNAVTIFLNWSAGPYIVVDPNKVLAAASNIFHTTPDEMRSRNRERNVLRARYAVMLFCRDREITTEAIGNLLNLTHSSVVHGCKASILLLQTNKNFADQLALLQQVLSGEATTA